MPVMSEQVRKARAERLLQLRFEEGMSPTAAWRVVSPNSKAADSRAAELCRREIRWHRKKYGSVDVPEESRVVRQGDEAGDQASASTRDAAVKPAKRCAGVEDHPCGKEIPARFTRCKECGKEHDRLRRKVDNRNYHAANKWGRWAKKIQAEVEARFEAERVAVEKRVEAETERKREVERRRQARIEAERKRLEAQKEAEWKRFEAELEAAMAALRAEEERQSKMPRHRMLEEGRSITEYHDGRRELHDLRTERSKMLQPGEPIPPRRIRFPTLDPWRR